MVAAARHHPLHQHRVEPVGLAKRVGDAVQRVLVEVEAGGAEGRSRSTSTVLAPIRSEIRWATLCARVEAPDAALGAAEGDLAADERLRRVGVEGGDRARSAAAAAAAAPDIR